jgi:hypothetical protein
VAYDVSTQFQLDTSAPAFTSISFINEASDGYINLAEKDAASDLVASPVSSGADTTEYKVAANSATCSSLTGFSSTKPKVNDAGMTGDGSWKVCVKLSDNAANVTYGASSAVVRDIAAPSLSSALALQAPADDLFLNSTDRTLSNALVAAASTSESATVTYTVADGACASAAGYGSSIPAANTTAITGDGTWKVCVKLMDTAGNAAYANSADITVDSSGPVFTSLSLSGAATDGYVTASENALATDLAGSLTGSGYTTDAYKLVRSSTTCAFPLSFGTMPKANSTDFSGDGEYKVCVRLVDAAGNMTFGASGTFILDSIAPSFTSLDLANLALDGYLNASDRTGTSGITGTLTASGHSTVSYRSVTSTTQCSGVGSWSGTAPLANDSAISGDGTWKVCVRLADDAGNITYGATANLVVDITGASLASSLALANAASDGYINAAEVALTTDVISSPSFNETVTSTYVLSLSAGDCSSASSWAGTLPKASAFGSSPYNSDAIYKVCVKAVDAAGNTAYYGSPSITRDTGAPSFTSLALANAATDLYLNSTERGLTSAVAGSLSAEAGAAATYAAASSGATCNASLTYASGIPAANDSAFASDGSFKVCVKLLDTAGNDGYGASSAFTVDTVGAAFGSVSLANTALDGYLSLADRSLGTSISGDAAGTGVDNAHYAVILSTSNCGSAVSFGAAGVKPAANTASITADGSWKLCVKVTDSAGNPADYGSSIAFVVDTAKPSSTVSSSGVLTITSTSGATTTLEGATSDVAPSSGISSVEVSIDSGSGNCLNSAKSAWNASCPNWLTASTGTSSWSLAVDDGMFLDGASYTVSVRANDAAGNQQASAGTSTVSWSASEGTDLWNKNVTFDGSNAAQAMASAVDSQGRLVVVGYDTSGATRGRIKRYTRHGVVDAAIDITIGNGTNAVVAYGVAIGSSDSIFVVGTQSNGSNNDWFIKKYSSEGVEDTSNWNKTYNGVRGDDDIAYAVSVASDGSVVVAGHSRRAVSGSTGDDWRIMKYSSTGTVSCSQNVDVDSQGEDDRIKSLVIRNSTSKVYVAGWSDSTGIGRSWAIGEFDLVDCSHDNDTVLSHGAGDEAHSIALDSTGQLVVAGKTTEYATTPDLWLEVMSTSFASTCSFRTNVSALGEGLAVAVDSLDNIFVGGYRTGTNENWWLRKFSTTCTEDTTNWNKILNGTGDGNDRIQALSVSSGTNDANHIYAVGWGSGAVAGSGNNDWWIKKFAGVD